MRTIRKTFIALCLFGLCVFAQGQSSGNIQQPTFQWRCETGDTMLNFNPATTSILYFDSIPYAKDYTLIVVYKPVSDTESTVWHLLYGDSATRSLTTERILSGNTAIRYADSTDSRPAIHTLRQSAPESDTSYIQMTLGDGNIKVSEVLYFDHRLGNSALRRVQSALAIRYGITLGPVDYIGGNGNRVWQHRRDSAMFHHRITGIGSDTACNLHQLCSRSEMDGSVVTLSADSLPQGAYLLVGDNDAPLTFQQEDGNVEILARQWRVQASGAEDVDFSLSFDTRNIPTPTDSLVLLLDDNIVLPSVATTNEVRFNNLWLPSDTCTFTLARGSMLWQLAQSGTKGAKGHSGNDDKEIAYSENSQLSAFNFQLFPNPTTGHFNIEVSGARQVHVTIYNLQGKEMAVYNDSDRDQYFFEGSLPSGNVYYATITTESGSQTMKLVVK